jgi:nucleoside-diphosphate-sugar epimerase
MTVYNQTTELISIVDIAKAIVKAAAELKIASEIKHIPNPRVEDEEHQMTMTTANFDTLLPSPKYSIASGIRAVLESLLPHIELIRLYKDRFMTGS